MPVDADLAAAAQRRADALAARDGAALRRLLHPAFRWTSHRGESVDRQTYIANNTAGSLVWRRQSLRHLETTVVDDTGVVTAVAVDDVERNGVPMTFRMPMTQTWVRSDGRWQCLAGHAGPVLDQPAGGS